MAIGSDRLRRGHRSGVSLVRSSTFLVSTLAGLLALPFSLVQDWSDQNDEIWEPFLDDALA